jgi:hypothetical protein
VPSIAHVASTGQDMHLKRLTLLKGPRRARGRDLLLEPVRHIAIRHALQPLNRR